MQNRPKQYTLDDLADLTRVHGEYVERISYREEVAKAQRSAIAELEKELHAVTQSREKLAKLLTQRRTREMEGTVQELESRITNLEENLAELKRRLKGNEAIAAETRKNLADWMKSPEGTALLELSKLDREIDSAMGRPRGSGNWGGGNTVADFVAPLRNQD